MRKNRQFIRIILGKKYQYEIFYLKINGCLKSDLSIKFSKNQQSITHFKTILQTSLKYHNNLLMHIIFQIRKYNSEIASTKNNGNQPGGEGADYKKKSF